MKWTIRQLNENQDDIIRFNENLELSNKLQERESSIIHAETVNISGYIVPSADAYIIHGEINTNLTLPSTRSLEPVQVHLNVPIKERYVYEEHDGNIEDYEETTIVLEHDYIDIEQAVIELIVINLPTRVLKPEEEDGKLPSGKNWEVVTEDDHIKNQEKELEAIDPRFAALKTLLDKEENQ